MKFFLNYYLYYVLLTNLILYIIFINMLQDIFFFSAKGTVTCHCLQNFMLMYAHENVFIIDPILEIFLLVCII